MTKTYKSFLDERVNVENNKYFTRINDDGSISVINKSSKETVGWFERIKDKYYDVFHNNQLIATVKGPEEAFRRIINAEI